VTLAAASAPPDIATNYSGWRAWRNARITEFEANCPRERAVTYYFDATSGNDSNDGLTELTPKQTRAAAIALTGTGRRFRFKRGEVWRETGNWSVGSDVTIDAYGTGANPIFDRFTVRHLAASDPWGSQSGNRWQVAETTDVAWIKLAAFPLTRPLQRVADATACAATTNSWVWSANVLYINLGTDNPNDFDIDVCPSNDGESGVEFTNDGSRVEDIDGYGWGCHRTALATQDQPVTSRARGDNANLAVGCGAYYSGSHALAHNMPTGGEVGGRFMAINCRAGYTKYNTSGETVFNTYTEAGGQETWWINCHADYGTLPSSDWAPATNLLQGIAFYCHTGGTPFDLVVIDGCTIHSENAYGPIQAFHASDMPTVTDADRTTYRHFYVGNTQNMASAATATNNNLPFTSNTIFYNNDINLYPVAGSTHLDALQDGQFRENVWLIQNRFTLNMLAIGNANYGFVNPHSGEEYELFWYHNWIELTNGGATTNLRFGLDFDCRGISTAAGLGVPGAGTARLWKFVNNVLKQTGGTTSVYFLGVTNTSNCKNNRLHGIGDTAGVERGYNLTTSPITTGDTPVWNTSNTSLLSGSAELVLSHDFFGKRRRVAAPDIGPIDFSSVDPPGSIGSGIVRSVNARVDAGVETFVTSHS